jgi:hypothetical protein
MHVEHWNNDKNMENVGDKKTIKNPVFFSAFLPFFADRKPGVYFMGCWGVHCLPILVWYPYLKALGAKIQILPGVTIATQKNT